MHYLIAGRGAGGEQLYSLARQCGVEERVHLLGYRADVPELMAASDLYAFPSYREGLPVSMMEAMAMGKAVVCSRIRGNVDLLADGEGGFMRMPDDVAGFAEAIRTILGDAQLRCRMGLHNREVMEHFSRKTVEKTMAEQNEADARSYAAITICMLCRELRLALEGQASAASTASAQRTPSTAADVMPPA